MPLLNLYVNGLLPMPALLADPSLMEHIGEAMLGGFAPVEQLGQTLETLERAIAREAPNFQEDFAAASSEIRRMLTGNGTPWEFQEEQQRAAGILSQLRERRLLVPVLEATGWKSPPELRPSLALPDVNALSHLTKLADFSQRVTQHASRRGDALFAAGRFLRAEMTEAHFASPNIFYEKGRPAFIYGSAGAYGPNLLFVAPFRIPPRPLDSKIPEEQNIVISEESLYAPGVASLAGPIAVLSGILAYGHPTNSLPMVVHFVAYDEERGYEPESEERFVETFLGRRKGQTLERNFEIVIEMDPSPRASRQDPLVSRRTFSGKRHAAIGVAGAQTWAEALNSCGFAGPSAVGTFERAGSFTDLLVERFGPFPHYRLQIADESCEAGTEDENVGIGLWISVIRLLVLYFNGLKSPEKYKGGKRKKAKRVAA